MNCFISSLSPFLLDASTDRSIRSDFRNVSHQAQKKFTFSLTQMIMLYIRMKSVLYFSVADFSKCTRSFSVLFVAFDFEEWEDCSNKTLYPRCACGQIDCGSRAFVANFSRFYNGSSHSIGKLQGAIIMDTVMNYNSTPNSQILPFIIRKAFPGIYNQSREDSFRGNFFLWLGE